MCQDDRPQRSTGNSNSKVKRSLCSESVDVSSCVENDPPFVSVFNTQPYLAKKDKRPPCMTLKSNKFKSTPAFPGRLLCLVVGNAARPLAVALSKKGIKTVFCEPIEINLQKIQSLSGLASYVHVAFSSMSAGSIKIDNLVRLIKKCIETDKMCSIEIANYCHWTRLTCVRDLTNKQSGAKTHICLGDSKSPWRKYTTFVSWNIDLQLIGCSTATAHGKFVPRRDHSEPYPKELVSRIAQTVYDNVSMFTIWQLDRILHSTA